MKYTPLNLSFLSNQYNPQADQIRQTAQYIMANAGFSKETAATMKQIAEAQKKAQQNPEGSMHKQSFLSSVFDALQTPLYTVANALDKGLAGHQSDSDDSVLEDVWKTVKGGAEGAWGGYKAGWRGATGMLDAIPGVDINDDWQSNPTNKTHFSDVAIRQQTGMSTKEAMEPKNWAKIQPKLEKAQDKSLWDKTFFELFIPDDLNSPDAQQKFIKNNVLAGIPVDVGADPLNFFSFGAGGAAGAAKAASRITEGLDAARAATNGADAISIGLKNRAFADKLPKLNLLGEAPPVAGIADNIKLPKQLMAPAADEIEMPHQLMSLPPSETLSSAGEIARGNTASLLDSAIPAFRGDQPFKTLAKIGRREAVPVEGKSAESAKITYRQISNAAGQISQMARNGGKGWIYRAADHLTSLHSGVEWDRTLEFLDKAERAVTSKGGRHIPEKLAPVVIKHMQEDIEAFGAAKKAEAAEKVVRAQNKERRLLNEPGPFRGAAVRDGEIVNEAGGNGPRLKVAEARIANRAIRKFENEILGQGRAPGTYEGLARAIARGDNMRYSGPQQARMWNHIDTLYRNVPPHARYRKVTRTLRAVEDYFISKGMRPYSAAKAKDSAPLRLSAVAEALGPDFLGKSHAFITGILRGDSKALSHLTPEQIEKLRALRESEAVATAPAVSRGIDFGRDVADVISKAVLSAGRKKELIAQAARKAGETAAIHGGGEVGAHVAEAHTKMILGATDEVNATLSANKLKTEAWLGKVGATGKGVVNDPDFAKSVTNAIQRASGLPSPKALGGIAGAGAKVADWLGARFNASYGIQDMSPILLREQASAMSTTARRAKLINNLGRRFSPKDTNLWHEATRAAQKNGISSGPVAELQSEFSEVMENLFGGTGLRIGAISDSTVVGRNRILMDELNKNLKRFGLGQFKFEAKKLEDADGVVHDLTKGVDWMRSWETWNIKKPYEFLHQIQNAVEYTVREKNMFDEIVARFASPVKHGDVKYGVDHPRLKGFYFNQEGAKQAQQFVHMLEQISAPNSKTLQYFDHVLSKLKAGLTIYIPGHHMTNLIGSVYFNWIAGVNKPIRYEQAIKTMLSQKGRYGEFSTLDKLTGPKALEQAVARSLVSPDAGLELPAAGTKVIIKMQNGTKVTADMLYTAANREAILPMTRVLEDIDSGVTSVLDKIKPLGGRGQRAVHEFSEIREHIPRLALFIDRVAKHKGTFAEAVTDASAAVRKWHPDGLGFTNFERKFMKRVFPFYSWTRKAIPLSIESLLFAGSKVMAYPRLMEAIGLINGVDPNQAVTDPFPNDQMFPDWLRTRGIGPIAGSAGNYSVINPSTPVLDVLAQIGNPGTTGIDMLNPMAKVPIETMQGQTLGRGQQMQTNAQWLDYAAKQIPVVSQAGRASGQFGVSSGTKAEGFPNWTNIINLLTGAKKVDTRKYEKSAQFDLRDYFKQKANQQGR
ncbi:hypothetical protein [Streptomyces sp. NPDC048720]|uniref:hypothetical protein n=1 Tax=Streptomyces sp. NPDC048720 TaxID=3365588 RepID=UPI003716AAE7